ncbi:MAG TPA: hypothetical protein VEH62_04425 [Gemmatimonadales bacterium]|nr:hypothetical protein [Gemmatimonadales bacterium]
MKRSAPLWRATYGGCLVAAAWLLQVPAARAQATGDGFLFRAPGGSIRLWTGYDRALANSPIFQFVTDTFTLSKSSFGAFAIGADVAVRVAPQAEVVFSAGWAGSKAGSEYRHWIGSDSLPIRQTTSLERVPLTVSLKWYLVSPGQSIGHFAWVPARIAPFVGAGGGLMWYRFQQYGDFINFADSTVVNDALASEAWTGSLHAFAGMDVALGPRYLLTGKAQYTWARSHLGADFVGPNAVDLSGLSVTVGVGVRF